MKTLFFSLVLALACPPVFSAPLPEDLDVRVSSGINDIHSLEFDAAEKEFSAILDKYPGQPYGYFGLAMTSWARLEYAHEESSPEMDALFAERTETAVKKGEEWLKKNPLDASAHVCVGGMYGLRSRLALMKHRWIRAYFDGKKGLSHMNKAIKLDPQFYDAYLGPGMYEYYAGTLPAVVRILAKLFISGDPDKGIGYLKLVKEKGKYTATAAKLLLIEIYTQTASKYANPALALEWAKELRQAYPGNPMIHFVEIVSLYEAGKMEEVKAEAEDYAKKIDENAPFYRKIYAPRALLALGTAYFAEKQWEKAAEYFTAASQSAEPGQNRWAVWALVRLGNVQDLEGDRKEAISFYKKALSYKDRWGFKEYISRYISKPYKLSEVPGQLPPP